MTCSLPAGMLTRSPQGDTRRCSIGAEYLQFRPLLFENWSSPVICWTIGKEYVHKERALRAVRVQEVDDVFKPGLILVQDAMGKYDSPVW